MLNSPRLSLSGRSPARSTGKGVVLSCSQPPFYTNLTYKFDIRFIQISHNTKSFYTNLTWFDINLIQIESNLTFLLILQEFSRADPEYLPPEARHDGMSGEVAQHLSNYGHEKFVEDAHGQSVWTVLPINHILGKLLLTPANSKPWKCSKDDNTSHVWWSLPMASNWGRDKGYKLLR